MSIRGFGLVTIAGLFALGAACSSSDKPSVFTGDGGAAGSGGSHAGSGNHGGGGSGGKGGSAGSVGEAGEGNGGEANQAGQGGGGNEAGAPDMPATPQPIVAITSPAPVTDPNLAPVLVTNGTDHVVTAVCTAQMSTLSGALPVDPSSVKITFTDSSNHTISGVTHATANAGEYAADFELKNSATPISTGKVSFQCSASDTAPQPSTGTATVSTFLDKGPAITLSSPAADTKNALAAPLQIDFTVAPAPLIAGDAQSAVASVTLTINGIGITLPAPDANGHYSFPLKLNDKNVFAISPTGTVPIAIEATNMRAPKAAVAQLTYNIIVDGTPPAISIATPIENSVVGQQVTLKFTVSDDLTGVPPTSVSVDLNGTKYSYSSTDPQWTPHAPAANGDTYTFTFPSSIIPDPKTQGSAAVHASDGAGNASPGVSREFFFDTSAPIVDLNPAALRERQTIQSTHYCSDPFDPLGATAANDGQVVPDAARFRALVWDTTNSAFGQPQTQLHYAGLSTSSVVLYAQPHTATALLKNSSGGTACDTVNINEEAYPAKLLSLNPITAPGSSPKFSTAFSAIANVCEVTTQAATPPLCSGTSDLTAVVQHLIPNSSPDPAVFGSGSLCGGDQWFLPKTVATADGWVCLVAVATDNAGNRGFSAPIRVCLDAADSNGDGFVGSPPCVDPVASPPPSCTDGCTPPAHFNPVWVDQ